MKTPFVGSANTAYSQALAANRLINLYAEKGADGAKEPVGLFGTPGLTLLATVGTGPIRGILPLDTFLYVVSGERLWRVNTSYQSFDLGGVASGSTPVSMTDNGTQVFIACGTTGYIYNATTNVFARITDADFPGAVTVNYLKGYFVFNPPDLQTFWVTSLLDGTAIDPLDYASAEGLPDNVVGVIADHEEEWVFGETSIEVYYVTQDSTIFPLQRMQGAFIEQGCAAAFSIAKMDNSIFWLGKNDKGHGVVFRANGYTPIRVSTHAIEEAIRGYSTISDAVAYTYQQRGHSFYVLTFPTGNATWVFDAATNWWHERAYLDPSSATFGRHRSNCHAFFNNINIVGDYANGKLYKLDLDVYADNGDPLKWLRSWRSGANDKAHHELQLMGEVGVGLATGQGSNPQVMLRWSDDGGYNWSNEHWLTQGAIGARSTRMRWTRLGRPGPPNDRVYEASGTDAVKRAFTGADLRVSE